MASAQDTLTSTSTSVNDPLKPLTDGVTTTATTGGLVATAAPQTAQAPLVTPESLSGAPAATGLVADAAPVAAPRQITSDETVAGRLQALIDQDSPYMQSAKANGMNLASARGGVNSGLAAQISQKAAIDAAAPIAAQDASTTAASGLSSQNAIQSNEATTLKSGLDLSNAETLQAQQGTITSALNAQQQQATADLQKSLKALDVSIDLQKIAATDRNSYTAAVSPVMQQYQTAFTNIQIQPDSVLSPEAKANALAQLAATYKPQIQSISNIYGYAINW